MDQVDFHHFACKLKSNKPQKLRTYSILLCLPISQAIIWTVFLSSPTPSYQGFTERSVLVNQCTTPSMSFSTQTPIPILFLYIFPLVDLITLRKQHHFIHPTFANPISPCTSNEAWEIFSRTAYSVTCGKTSMTQCLK